MITTPEQFVQLNKSTLESVQAVALASLDGFQKLAELNIQAVRASIDDSTVALKQLLDTRDPKALVEFSSVGFQPTAEKAAAYARNVYEITSTTNNEIARIVEKQFAETNRQVFAALDTLALNAPGAQGVANLVKQAITNASNAYGQVSRAGQQAVAQAEANVNAAAANAQRAGRQATQAATPAA